MGCEGDAQVIEQRPEMCALILLELEYQTFARPNVSRKKPDPARDYLAYAPDTVNGSSLTQRPRTPVQMQSARVDFGGVVKLAEALDKLNPSGRLLIGSVVFAGIGSIS